MAITMISTGLLFGSFNPVHIGHIAIAGYMKEFAGMNEIWFIVSPQNPHKDNNQLAGAAERLEMVRLAIGEHPSFVASEIEFDMPVPSYTVDTMQKLKSMYNNREFYIIIGTDNVGSIGDWKGYKILIKDYKFLIYPRLQTITSLQSAATGTPTGFGKAPYMPDIDPYRLNRFSNAKLVDAPVIGISSSFIRKSVREGRDMRAFVPLKAYDYLIKNHIYH